MRLATRRSPRLLLVFSVCALALPTSVLRGAEPTGSLAGEISNANTGNVLEGARVAVPQHGLTAFTDNTGRYTLGGLPAGTHEVIVSYTGLDTALAQVAVEPAQRVTRDFDLTSAIYQLDQFVVAGEREGNAVSITRQRNADHVVNILSMDSFGNVADGNVGNFMQRLPGIGAIIENGDIVGFGVRGTPSELNSVTIDGARMSNAYGGANPQGDRAVVIDSIPSPTSDETHEIPSHWRVHFETSMDGGLTWARTRPLNDGIRLSAIQPSILFHGNGRLQAIGRTRQQKIFEIWSEDNGRTWGSMGLLKLPNPNSGTDAVTLKDGRHLLVYNHTTSGRSPLNLAVSRDGKSWEAARALETAPGEYSYPAVVQTIDGLVHITYTWKRERIKHVSIDPSRIISRPIVDGIWPSVP